MSGGLPKLFSKNKPLNEMPSYADLPLEDTSSTFTVRASWNTPEWLDVAFGEIGILEIAGDKDHPRIIEYLSTVKLSKDMKLHDEIAWCAASVNWILKTGGSKGTNKPNAKSYLDWGIKLLEPKFGCIVILNRGTEAWQGHVGFFLDQSKGFVTLLGGNQNNRFGINKYKMSDIEGYRWPA